MKKVLIGFSALALTISVNAQTKKAPAAKSAKPAAATSAISMKTSSDSLSYAFGISLGAYMKSQGITNINYALLNKAIDQSLRGQPTAMDAMAANTVMQGVAEKKAKAAAQAEKAKGQQFLVENKKRSGVVETKSGLQYEILTRGTGPIPTAADTVIAHYRGSLINGKEFDNSYSRGEPLTIPVSGVIAGWTEALQLMPVGSKWKLYIPAALGYGDFGAGQDIPGGATLVFEVELVDIANNQTK